MILLKLKEPLEATNDNKILIVKDDTGAGNTGWGTGTNAAFSSINGTTNELTLSISITDVTGVETTYDTLDFYTYNSNTAPTNLIDLQFAITAADLQVSGVPLGTSEDALPEGFYEFTYTLSEIGVDTIATYEAFELIDTLTRNKVYNLVRSIPDSIYTRESVSLKEWETANKYISYYSYLAGMKADLSLSDKTRVLNQLYTLQTILINE